PDFMLGWIKTLDPDRPGTVADFASGLKRPVDLKFGAGGNLYVLLRHAWVIDKDFKPNTGSLIRIDYAPGSGPAPKPDPLAEGRPAPPPPLAPEPGDYTGPITVRLNLGGEGETVRATLDGSPPSPSSPVYSGPFRLAASATVIARSFRGDRPLGEPVSATYRIEGEKPYGLPDRPEVRGLNVPLDPSRLAPPLSQTGVFASLSDLTPAPGIVPYAVNSPLWSDGALKRRWVALPGGETIGFLATGEWTFPRETVFIKHFEL